MTVSVALIVLQEKGEGGGEVRSQSTCRWL